MTEINPEYVAQVRQVIGGWLQEFRKEKKINQTELAEMLGVNVATVSKMETGRWLSLEMLIKVSVVLDFFIFLVEKNSTDELATAMRDRWRRAHDEN
ncbi:MAG: helix-turn-helix transcriptional regulator [Paludibacter sp.]